jgi:signal transduction histidine kinase
MTDRRITALLVPSLVAGALLGILVFLFVRSEPLGVATDAHALTILRDMRYLDARLDAEALARANDLAQDDSGARRTVASAADRAALFEPPLRQLANEAPHAAVAGELPQLRAALADKQRAYAGLEAAHQRSRGALDEFERAMPGNAARGDTAGGGDRFSLLLGHLDEAFRRSDVRDFAKAAARLEPLAAALDLTTAGARPAVREIAARSRAAAQAFLGARAAESAAWERYRFATAGEKIALTSRTLARDIAATLADKERWRLYLYLYGTALFLALAYAGARTVTVRRSLVLERDALQRRLDARSTEAAIAVERLEAAETRLIDAQKMSALGRMVAGVAHEIEAPLARAKGSLEEARRRMPDVREACERAERLVELLAAPAPDVAAIEAARAGLARRLDELRDFRALDRLHAMAWEGAAGVAPAQLLTLRHEPRHGLQRERRRGGDAPHRAPAAAPRGRGQGARARAVHHVLARAGEPGVAGGGHERAGGDRQAARTAANRDAAGRTGQCRHRHRRQRARHRCRPASAPLRAARCHPGIAPRRRAGTRHRAHHRAAPRREHRRALRAPGRNYLHHHAAGGAARRLRAPGRELLGGHGGMIGERQAPGVACTSWPPIPCKY